MNTIIKNKVLWGSVISTLLISTFVRVYLTLFYSPVNSEILQKYYTFFFLNIIFSLVTLVIVFISILGTYITLVLYNRIVSHEEIYYPKAKMLIYKIYMIGFSIYNIFYSIYLLIENKIWEGAQLNILSIIFFFLLSLVFYKYSNFFNYASDRLFFSILIFFINSFLAIFSLIKLV